MGSFVAHAWGVTWAHDRELVRVEAWGPNSLRVRSTIRGKVTDLPGSALLDVAGREAKVQVSEELARVENGEVVAEMSRSGRLRFLGRDGREFFAEHEPHFSAPPQRRYMPVGGDVHQSEVLFDAPAGERVYGLGQHQHGLLDQKGTVIDLVQRNTEVSIPFVLSSRGYGFLWNHPGVGRVELARNHTRWVAEAARQIDYWVTAAPVPATVVSQYAAATGLPPMLPEWASGFWQSKLRYRTQEELLGVVREHKRRGLPLSAIVIDFFHWTRQGEWEFDRREWPDPAAMVQELKSLGVECIVSVWPTVNPNSKNYSEMEERGLLVGNELGNPLHLPLWDKDSPGTTFVRFYDATNPDARRYIWEKVKSGYYRHGIKTFWLDACEPEVRPENPGNLMFHLGGGAEVQNVYPRLHAQGFFEGLREVGEGPVLSLCRSAWAGSQRWGVALWSGDVESSFAALAAQVPAGMNAGISGIPWWTSDIGGFYGGHLDSPSFRELVVRWSQFGLFCPLFRLHGSRDPGVHDGPNRTGAANEVWSFGDDVYEIFSEQLRLRELLRPYLMAQMANASATGVPPMRPLFLDFPDDTTSWEVDDQFLLGPDVLVAPVTAEGVRDRAVYLPAGSAWTSAWTGKRAEGGTWLQCPAPLERIPVFLRDGGDLPASAMSKVRAP